MWKTLKQSVKWACIVFGALIVLGMFLPDLDPEFVQEREREREAAAAEREREREAAAAAEREREREAAAAEAENERKGFHCLSSWDGDHNGLERLVRARLNDPDSMDTLGTYIAPVNDAGKHPVRMEFTATNAFGGRVRNNAIGLIDNRTCEATLLSIG